jgi:molybdopterin-guanine dinucleotide biosynthesis protein A
MILPCEMTVDMIRVDRELSTIHYISYAFLLAGGKNARMGTDKAWVEIKGRPMIERALAAAAPVVARLGIVIDPSSSWVDRYEQLAATWSAELVPDLHDHRGPLGGIHTALRHCHKRNAETSAPSSILILACDLPFVTAEFLSLLARIHQSESNDLTLPVDSSGRLQPLAAIYSETCLIPVEQMLDRDLLRVDQLCGLVRSRQVPFSEFNHLPNAERLLVNLNTAEDVLSAANFM